MGHNSEVARFSGADELRRVVAVLNNSREGASDGFTAEELVRIVRACVQSDWDLCLHDLTYTERQFAAKHGRLAAWCVKRLSEDLDGCPETERNS